MRAVQKNEYAKAILIECREIRKVLEKLLRIVAGLQQTIPDKEDEDKDTQNVSLEIPKDVEYKITQILKDIGVPAHIKGYNCLRISIFYIWKNGKCSMTKELYPYVANVQNTESSKVERAIRHAIECAWNRGNPRVFEKYFGYSSDHSKGKPTNAEFIYMISNYLQFN